MEKPILTILLKGTFCDLFSIVEPLVQPLGRCWSASVYRVGQYVRFRSADGKVVHNWSGGLNAAPLSPGIAYTLS